MKINIGCGETWREYLQKYGYKGLDLKDFGQDFVCDVREGLPFKDMGVDYIHCQHFLEHLTYDEAINFLNECWRVLSKDGELKIIVPHVTKSEGAFVLTHRSFYTEKAFKHLENENIESVYGIKAWEVLNLLTNSRGDIHALLRPNI